MWPKSSNVSAQTHFELGHFEARGGQFRAASSELELARGFLERLVRIRPRDVIFRTHLMKALGQLADIESEIGSAKTALSLEQRATNEAEEILRINPRYHPASHQIAIHLRRAADLSWELGDSDGALCKLDRAESILRQLIVPYPEVSEYRYDLANTLRARVQKDQEIGRDRAVGGSASRGAGCQRGCRTCRLEPRLESHARGHLIRRPRCACLPLAAASPKRDRSLRVLSNSSSRHERSRRTT